MSDVDEAAALAELAGTPGYRAALMRPRAIAKLRALEDAAGVARPPVLGELVDVAVRWNA